MTAGKTGYLDVTVMPSSVGRVRVYWREDCHETENYSTLTVTDVQGYLWHRTAWAYVSASLTADGVTVLPDTGGRWMYSAASDTVLRSVVSASDVNQRFTPVTSGPIYHEADGTKSVTVTLTLHDITAPAVSFNGTDNQTAAQVIELTPLPRASSVSGGDGTVGSPVTLTVGRANAAFVHTLTYVFQGVTGVIAERSADTAFLWTPPMELCAAIPAADSGICTVTCHTYSGETLIGTSDVSVTLRVPEDVGLTLFEGWAKAQPHQTGAAEGMAVYVQGYSAAQVVFDETKIGRDRAYGAEIAGFSVEQGAVTADGGHRTAVFQTAGTAQVRCTVTDTRGRCCTESLAVEVLPYAKPTLSGIEVFRCDSDGTPNDGGYALYVAAVCGFSSLDGQNRCTLEAAYGSAGGSLGTAAALESGSGTVLWAGELSPRQTYTLQLTAVDALGNRAVYTAVIPTDEAFFHGRQGGRGAAFGKYAEADDLLEVAWNLSVAKDLTVAGDAAVGGSLTVGGESLMQVIAAAADPLRWMPVGFVYISSRPTSPAELFGGTWEQLTDRVIVGAGGSYAADSTGGEAEHTLTIAEMPSHQHRAAITHADGEYTNEGIHATLGAATNGYRFRQYTNAIGGGQAHNNMPPYVAKYIWERVE
ncbi:MAG: hypothetical protein IJD81_09155 [Oscillospiraceae bacterium]|nr:hypothetical protein [Oscillospiraceae bacterium]